MGMEFLREACQRLPLADALLRLGQFVLSDDHLKEIFKRHSGRSYEKLITFRDLVSLIGDALLVNHGSATGEQLYQLAQRIRFAVFERYGVELEPEPLIV